MYTYCTSLTNPETFIKIFFDMESLKDLVIGSYHFFKLGSSHRRPGECLYCCTAELQSPQIVTVDTLRGKKPGVTRIIAVSDTHARHDGLGPIPEGDIFLHTGDILMTSSLRSRGHGIKVLESFNDWMDSIPCDHRVAIAGNHDLVIADLGRERTAGILSNCTYLENSHVTADGLTIWGTPLSRGKSHNNAFQCQSFRYETERALAAFHKPIDLILSHGPCLELHDSFAAHSDDLTLHNHTRGKHYKSIHFWGHCHAAHGVHMNKDGIFSVCSSIMDENYDLSNPPIIIDVNITKL